MSKPKSPRKTTAPSPITADSPATDVLKENIRIHLELMRRQAYQRFLVLRAELAALPPVPEDHEA